MPLDWTNIRVNVGARGRVRCGPGWHLAASWADNLTDYDLWFVWAGRGTMQLRDKRVELRPGVGFWMRPGGHYAAQQDLRDRIGASYIHFTLDGPSDDLPPEYFEATDATSFDGVMRRIVELGLLHQHRSEDARHRMQNAMATMLKSLLMEVEILSLDQPEQHDASLNRDTTQKIMRAAAKIAEDPADAPSVEMLSEMYGYSSGHFTRLFKSLLGQSPKNYTVMMRIERGKQLLRETGQSITDIAATLGYPDAFAFSSQFKKKTGKSPSDYRARK